MKMLVYVLFFFSSMVMAAEDTGKIVELHVDKSGGVAIQLDKGFPKSREENKCGSYTGWAGVISDSKSLKSALLAAYATQDEVVVGTSGCIKGGYWLEIQWVTAKKKIN